MHLARSHLLIFSFECGDYLASWELIDVGALGSGSVPADHQQFI